MEKFFDPDDEQSIRDKLKEIMPLIEELKETLSEVEVDIPAEYKVGLDAFVDGVSRIGELNEQNASIEEILKETAHYGAIVARALAMALEAGASDLEAYAAEEG